MVAIDNLKILVFFRIIFNLAIFESSFIFKQFIFVIGQNKINDLDLFAYFEIFAISFELIVTQVWLTKNILTYVCRKHFNFRQIAGKKLAQIDQNISQFKNNISSLLK